MAPKTVDEYIATFPEDLQRVLEELRRTIRDAAPQAKEKISYSMPTFTQDGPLIYFAAWKSHVGLYGASGALEAFKAEVSPYIGEKGSLRFPLTKPLPLSLISDIVKFGVKEKLAKARQK